jgi:hypothetical protein
VSKLQEESFEDLRISFLKKLENQVVEKLEARVIPLPDSSLGFYGWYNKYFYDQKPLGYRHEKLYEWGNKIELGKHLNARCEFWPRGSGKTTAAHILIAWLCTCMTRRHVLYVAKTAGDAEKVMISIMAKLLRVGAKPKRSEFTGKTSGWKSSQIITENGFCVTVVGIDQDVRGLKVEDLRPDFIVIDDVDSLGDSIRAVLRKLEIISGTILPAGSIDVTCLFIENLIHSNSISSMLATNDPRCEILSDRECSEVYQALDNCVIKTIPATQFAPATYQVYGDPTWIGQGIEECQHMLNTIGPSMFISECQQIIHQGGDRVFDNFEPQNFHGRDLDGRHIIAMPEIPPNAKWIAGLDWGLRAPFAFILGFIDDEGIFKIVEECGASRLTNDEQVAMAVRLMEKYEIKKDRTGFYDVTVVADVSMWNKSNDANGMPARSCISFWMPYFRCMQGSQKRIQGWRHIYNLLESNRLLFVRGNTSEIQRNLSNAVYLGDTGEDVDDKASDIPPKHFDYGNALRYMLYHFVDIPEKQKINNSGIIDISNVVNDAIMLAIDKSHDPYRRR